MSLPRPALRAFVTTMDLGRFLTPFFSVLLFYLFLLPIWLSPLYTPIYVLAIGASYFFPLWRWAFAVWAVGFGALSVVVWGWVGEWFAVALTLPFVLASYLMALALGRGWCRAFSLLVFWLWSQVVEAAFNLALRGFLPPAFPAPGLVHAPFLYLMYLAIYTVHLKAVEKCCCRQESWLTKAAVGAVKRLFLCRGRRQ